MQENLRFRKGTPPTKRQETTGYSLMATLHMLDRIRKTSTEDREKKHIYNLMKSIEKLALPFRMSVALNVSKDQIEKEVQFGIDTLQAVLGEVGKVEGKNLQLVEFRDVLLASLDLLVETPNHSAAIHAAYEILQPMLREPITDEEKAKSVVESLEALEADLPFKLSIAAMISAFKTYLFSVETRKSLLTADRYPSFLQEYKKQQATERQEREDYYFLGANKLPLCDTSTEKLNSMRDSYLRMNEDATSGLKDGLNDPMTKGMIEKNAKRVELIDAELKRRELEPEGRNALSESFWLKKGDAVVLNVEPMTDFMENKKLSGNADFLRFYASFDEKDTERMDNVDLFHFRINQVTKELVRVGVQGTHTPYEDSLIAFRDALLKVVNSCEPTDCEKVKRLKAISDDVNSSMLEIKESLIIADDLIDQEPPSQEEVSAAYEQTKELLKKAEPKDDDTAGATTPQPSKNELNPLLTPEQKAKIEANLGGESKSKEKQNPQRLNRKQTKAILQLHEQGKTTKEISDDINVVEEKVQSYIDKNAK